MHNARCTMHNHPLFRRATCPQVAVYQMRGGATRDVSRSYRLCAGVPCRWGRSGAGLRCRMAEVRDRVGRDPGRVAFLWVGRVYHAKGMALREGVCPSNFVWGNATRDVSRSYGLCGEFTMSRSYGLRGERKRERLPPRRPLSRVELVPNGAAGRQCTW